MIKQIQLRGISRTPSDRMSEDGGLSESLNMYLDTAENAPAFVPKDVTSELGLPADLEAERIFIHKTSLYEHYVIQAEKDIYTYIDGEQKHIMAFDEGEMLIDINSIGNILVLVSSNSVHYALWKGTEYKYIGDNLPTPVLRFETEYNNDEHFYTNRRRFHYILPSPVDMNVERIRTFVREAWTQAARGTSDFEDENTYLKQVKEAVWGGVEVLKNRFSKWGYFCCPRLVRYAVRLYDGSYIFHSVPIMIGAGSDEWLTMEGSFTSEVGMSSIDAWIDHYYKASVKLLSWDIEGWEDIIAGVDVFISTDITFPFINSDFSECTDGGGKIFLKGHEDSFQLTQDDILSKQFYKILSFGSRDLAALKEGVNLAKNEIALNTTTLVQQEVLSSDYMTNHGVIPSSTSVLNSSLLVNGAAIELPNAPNEMNGLVPDGYSKTYRFQFYIRRNNGEEYVVDASNINGTLYFESPKFPYLDPVHGYGENYVQANPYAWIAFPDPNCYQVAVEVSPGDVYRIDMHEHPVLHCAYAFWGLSKNIETFTSVQGDELKPESEVINRYSIENQVMISAMNNPFVFPLENRFSFQSKVIGLAIATTALSQGQFGQFPLYVFTEDGIWAMETAADGSFISQKPLSREVCINPDSICSIDNAVVFVTAKAVMMIQGSQVMNISPYMNGRHYTPNESALNIIGKQEGFEVFTDVISDDDPFMSFMKDAKVAYDYTGQRLVFISPSNNGFQYVYKIDTQTWHKVAFEGLDLDTPLNSYPESWVKAGGMYGVYIDSPADSIEAEMSAQIDEVIEDFKSYFNTNTIGIPNILDKSNMERLCLGHTSIERLTKEEAEYIEGVIRGELDNDPMITFTPAKIYSLSTVLDAKPDPENPQKVAKGILITRPFDLGMPDVYKSITSIKIRGDFDKGNVKYILQGSNDGRTFYTLNTLRGKSWRMFRIFILADLEPTERISWIDVDFEPRYNNRLR